jgi:hypothetical protein
MRQRPVVAALLLGLFGSASAYALNRLIPKAEGYACIPVPMERLVAPGQRATMHVYDASSLQALRHAQAHANGTYGQVVIDEEAMQERRFALKRLGSRVQVLSMAPSQHVREHCGATLSNSLGSYDRTRCFIKTPVDRSLSLSLSLRLLSLSADGQIRR